jgi:hypothetical protein
MYTYSAEGYQTGVSLLWTDSASKEFNLNLMIFIYKKKNIICETACVLTPPTNGWSQLAYMPDRCFMAYTSAWLDLPAPGRETQIPAQRDREKERAQYILGDLVYKTDIYD